MGTNLKQRIAVTLLLFGVAMILIGFFSAGIGVGLPGVAMVAGSIAMLLSKRADGTTLLRRSSAAVNSGDDKLNYSEKLSRLRIRLRDPQWRRYGTLLLAGNTLGVALLFGLITVGTPLIRSAWDWGSTIAHAQEPAPAAAPAAAAPAPDPYKAVKGGDIVNPVNTAWVLLGAFLVFGMQAGFTMLEAGFCRNRETVNVLVECMFDTCVCGLIHWGWGFAFMFGGGNAFIGWHMPGDPSKSLIFMKDVGVLSTYAATGMPIFAHYLFQFAFADCASTICSGAMVGRTLFLGDVLYSIGVSGFIYPIFGHWCWGPDGFLATMGSPGGFLSGLGMNFHDFAGSTVVHSIGGWVAIAGAIMLGPRLGRKFKRDGGGPMVPHDLTIAVIGGLILWFGWYGFNPCSTLSIMDNAGVGRVAMNTTLAACTGGIAAIFIMYFQTKKWDTTAIINGFLAGLVAITCPCYWVSGVGACVIGAVAGVLVIVAMELLEHLPHRRSGGRVAGSRRVRDLGHAVAGLVRQRRILGCRIEPVRGSVDCRQVGRCSHRLVLRRRDEGAGGAIHRQLYRLRGYLRQRHGDVRRIECVRPAPRFQRGRTCRPGHRPARNLGVPGICSVGYSRNVGDGGGSGHGSPVRGLIAIKDLPGLQVLQTGGVREGQSKGENYEKN